MAKTPLSKYLRMLRDSKGFSQEDIAEKIGTSRASYSHYETGHIMPSNDILDKLASIYNVSLVDLIKLSAVSGKAVERQIDRLSGVAEISGIFADSTQANYLDSVYIDFIQNCPTMNEKELKRWMKPEMVEIAYYYSKLSEKYQKAARSFLKVLLMNESDNE